MITYKTLENTNIESLHQTFLSAFSDYEVKINLPLWKFQNMLKRRGYVPNLSIGAFEDEKLVGFVLNGFRNWNNKETLYDLGTGVIREYRKQGVTSSMLLAMKKLVKYKKANQYLLEVIKSNTAAVKLYKKQGFEIIRDFSCFEIDKNKYKKEENYQVKHINKIDETIWKKLEKFHDFKPSWQNSIDSIKATEDSFIYSIVYLEDSIAGYGVIDKKTGDIPQIAVSKDHRHKGIGRSIVTDLIKNTESHKINISNVDNSSKSMKEFLLKLGFENIVEQYEMILKL
ncbi:GNAT family N-acetyltransferase [Clostridium oceanicum]|uniref:GNAT family N-acetyltransferase n=1 Tax=Clostridium oceanicum TaxID=1543 RepID=A0ABP3UWF5_9CLOT